MLPTYQKQTVKYRWKLYTYYNSILSLADHAISAQLSAVMYKKFHLCTVRNNGNNSLAQKRTRHATNFLFSVHLDKYSEIRASVPTSKNMTASLWQGSSELVFNAKQRFKSRDGYSTKWARCVAKQPLMPAAVTSSDTQSSLLPSSASVSSLLEGGHSLSPSKSITFPGSSRYATITTYTIYICIVSMTAKFFSELTFRRILHSVHHIIHVKAPHFPDFSHFPGSIPNFLTFSGRPARWPPCS